MKRCVPRGQSILMIAAILVAIAALGIGGIMLRGGPGTSSRSGQPDTFAVKRGGFDVSIPVSGELAALHQIEIRNNLDGRAIITEVVDEGRFVQAGDVLLRLNDEDIRTKLRDAQDKANVADAALTASQAALEIKVKARQADLAKADLAIKLADLALKAWQEGEVIAKRQELALAIETNGKEYARLDERFKESGALLEKKFISLDEYKRDEIAMMKAKSDLELARLNSKVYEEYQFEQDKATKESALTQAHSERERVQQASDAEVRSAQSDVDSKQYQLDSAKEKLAELQQQLEYCTVKAPSPGMVVYFASTQSGGMGRNEGRPPQVGTELTRNELVIILPDTSQMVAAVKISEALVGQIQPGLHATIACDAMPDKSLSGEVTSVGVMAESGGWRDPNRRDYTVRILLQDCNGIGLKPSMRCKANLYVSRVEDALHIPVQAIFRGGPISYVYVPEGSGFAQRKVGLGRSSELFTEVIDGLKEGEIVLLREPDPDEVVSRISMPKQSPTQSGRGNDQGSPDSDVPTANAAGNGSDQPQQPGPGNRQRGSGGGRRGGNRQGTPDGQAPAQPDGGSSSSKGPSAPATASPAR